MFDIGFFELLLIAVVGLLVIGPERLPDAVRTTARWWSGLKRTLHNAREELEREVGADDIRRELHNERVMRELEESRREMEQALSGEDEKEERKPRWLLDKEEDYLPEQDEENEENLEDPEYPEHLHDHGDPELNPDHPDHRKKEQSPKDKDERS